MDQSKDIEVARGPLSGTELIARERNRQQYEEGWDAEHDEQHTKGEIAIAAACYAAHDTGQGAHVVKYNGETGYADAWPWAKRWDKRDTHPRIRQLTIAGALCAAEIDRLQTLGLQNEADAEEDAREKWLSERPEVVDAFQGLAHALGAGKGVNAAARAAVEKLRPLVFGESA